MLAKRFFKFFALLAKMIRAMHTNYFCLGLLNLERFPSRKRGEHKHHFSFK